MFCQLINLICLCFDFRGHVLLIVNVASNCGYTKRNYEQLVELDEKYRDSKGLRILAFPCNQFGKQVILFLVQLTYMGVKQLFESVNLTITTLDILTVSILLVLMSPYQEVSLNAIIPLTNLPLPFLDCD